MGDDKNLRAGLKGGSLSLQRSLAFEDIPTRCRAILRFGGLGYDNEQIGEQLKITPKTVSNRLSQLYTRLDVSNRVQAATVALRSGLVDLKETGSI